MFLRFLTHPNRSAITYYRIDVPAKTIAKLGLARTDVRLWVEMGQTTHERYATLMRSSGFLCYATFGQDFLALLKQIRKFPAEDQGEGRFAYPPCIFNDTDDNTHFVNPTNPAFGRLGTRIVQPDGSVEILKPGEPVNIINEQGDKIPLWTDGHAGFNVAANHLKIKDMDACYKACHGMSFTTARLRDYWKEALDLRNTYVFPNSVIFEDYPNIRTIKSKGQVRVLWQGGDSHYGDWYSIRPTLQPLSKKFPELRWVIWGSVYPFVHAEIPKAQLETEEWVPYDAYRIRLATLDFDFVVAPLVANRFNDAKTAIKFYEAAALPEPKPCLAANVPPYCDEIIDGETGLLYNDNAEFMVKFEALARDRKLRNRLAANAKDWIRDNRVATKTVPPYFEWITQTIADFQASRKPKAVGNGRPRGNHAGLSKRRRAANMRVVQKQVSRK